MMDCKDHIAAVREIKGHLLAITTKNGQDYELRRHFDIVLGMAERLLVVAPFAEGDRVVLTKTPDIEKGSGWWGSRHYLIEGSRGVVTSVDFHEEKKVLLGYVMFDDETYIHYEIGEKMPVKDKHVYCFGESWLRRCSP